MSDTAVAAGTRHRLREQVDQGVTRLAEQLDPVRVALLEESSTRAGEIKEHAASEAAAIIDEAEAAASATVDRSVQRSRAAADARAEQAIDRARADHHRVILSTQAAIRTRVLDATRRAAFDMRADSRYPALLDRLEASARTQLGADAVIERDPEGLGGVIATRGDRRVDYTLSALADRALDLLADDVALVWT
jgi:vacuolar-type H+-ATPase subunit E/Vma4